MGSSGLIYAAIVAGWAAFLVPRWVRRNEEVEQAREADAARGVRVLGPSVSLTSGARTQARHESVPAFSAEPVVVEDEQSASDHDSPAEEVSEYGRAARRRRRVVIVLGLALAAVTVVAVIGTLPLWSVAIPALLLTGFLQLARRAAVACGDDQARDVGRRLDRPAAPSVAPRRVAVLDEPEPEEPVDPHAWEPVPVPLPTYLTKPKAPDTGTRTIDLTQPGAWTSGRLEPAGPPMPPRPVPQPADDDVEELPEHRLAVGD
jgi:hypothetical protein